MGMIWFSLHRFACGPYDKNRQYEGDVRVLEFVHKEEGHLLQKGKLKVTLQSGGKRSVSWSPLCPYTLGSTLSSVSTSFSYYCAWSSHEEEIACPSS